MTEAETEPRALTGLDCSVGARGRRVGPPFPRSGSSQCGTGSGVGDGTCGLGGQLGKGLTQTEALSSPEASGAKPRQPLVSPTPGPALTRVREALSIPLLTSLP